MADSIQQLLGAVQAFKGEHGQKHEAIASQLERLVAEVHKGSAPPQDSPGRREAQGAAEKAMEHANATSAGNEKSNDPGSARPHERVDHPNIAGPNGRDDRLTGDVVFTKGNAVSNEKAPPADPSEARRNAAPGRDSRHREAPHGSPDSNTQSNPRGAGFAPGGKTQARGADQHVGEGAQHGPSGMPQPEAKPPYAGEPLTASFMRAAAEAKNRLKNAHRQS